MVQTISPAKQKFIDSALRLFAERGFHGVSLADVSDDLGLTKQSVLYHFKTKEALYAAVLDGLAVRFGAVLAAAQAHPGTPDKRAAFFVTALCAQMRSHPSDARMVARAILDVKDDSRKHRTWHLAQFVDASVEILAGGAAWRDEPEARKRAIAYQLIGAMNYFAISGPTLNGIWGAERLDQTDADFSDALIQLARLDPGAAEAAEPVPEPEPA